MQVETFECAETAAEPIEASEEAIALIDKLGLAGQRALVKPDTDTGRETRCPYRKMTADEEFAYRVLCPEESELARYDRSPIPLRVLQIAAHANSLDMFERIVVWDRATATVKDPVLVGIVSDKEWSWRKHCYILARWGDELETFVVLLKRACDAKRTQFVQKLESIRRSIDSEIAVAQSSTDEEVVSAGATAEVQVNIPTRR